MQMNGVITLDVPSIILDQFSSKTSLLWSSQFEIRRYVPAVNANKQDERSTTTKIKFVYFPKQN